MAKRGLIIGAIVAVISILITTLYDLGSLPSVVQCPEFLAVLGGAFVAGLLAARDTGRVRSGTGAGAIASALPALVIVGANVVVALVAPATFARFFGYHGMSTSQLVIKAVTQSLIGLIVWTAMGTGVGALGGLVGRARAAQGGVVSSTAN